jgi:hypothetical protein
MYLHQSDHLTYLAHALGIVDLDLHLAQCLKQPDGFAMVETRSEWRLLIKNASVASGQPSEREQFEALRRHAELELRLCGLEMPWNEMVGRHIQQPFSGLGEYPEMSCRAIVQDIERCLDWHQHVWLPLVAKLKEEGIDWGRVSGSIPREASPVAEYNAIQQLATKILPPLLLAEIGRRKRHECEEGFA